MAHTLILASSSPYRRELLARLQLPFDVVSPGIDETPLPAELPEATALRLAQQKARAVALSYPKALIIGCDQTLVVNGQVVGKPMTHDNAVRQLQTMSGQTAIFYSALSLLNAGTGNMQTAVVPCQVTFRHLDTDQIEHYVWREKPYFCAGSAKAEGLGIILISKMAGDDPNALIGLPLIALVDMLIQEGVTLL